MAFSHNSCCFWGHTASFDVLVLPYRWPTPRLCSWMSPHQVGAAAASHMLICVLHPCAIRFSV